VSEPDGPPAETDPLVDWALWYATVHGWPVFPVHTMRDDGSGPVCSCGGGCTKPGKHPTLTKHGWQDATIDPEQIRAWWDAMPDANIGTQYPSALDCDLPRDSDPGDGVAEWGKLEKKYGIVPGGAVAKSGGGGLHVYFAPGAKPGKRGTGLSMRGVGLYAVLPPSLHKSGQRYRWQRPPLAGRPLPAEPSWLAKRGAAAATKLKKKIANSDELIPVNERHASIAFYIGDLRRRVPQLPEDEALELAHAFRRNRCAQPDEKVQDVDDLIAYVYAKDPPVGDKPWSGPTPVLAELLEDARAFFTRYIVVTGVQADAVALWIAHTYVYDCGRATPYAHFRSPEPGSGKTAALEVLALCCKTAYAVDDLTAAAMFRLIEKRHPTLLFDEVDGVFGKKASDSTEDIRKVLNSGYKRGKKAVRCVPPSNEIKEFDVFCPKALAGLHELPGTLAHRAIPIDMQPPLPSDLYVDLDDDEALDAETATLRSRFQAWADSAEPVLRDPRLKPVKLFALDARGNEIWRTLFRISDLAGEDWPERARAGALELSGGSRRADDVSQGIQLLADIRRVFVDTSQTPAKVEDRLTCKVLAELLNALDGDEGEWGGWNDGKGITTRQIGRRLKSFRVLARKLRLDGERTANGYEREQFEAVWERYLPHSEKETGTNRNNVGAEPSRDQRETGTSASETANVPVSKNGANLHEHSDVPVCSGFESRIQDEEPEDAGPGGPEHDEWQDELDRYRELWAEPEAAA
jgi:hypothetical protein